MNIHFDNIHSPEELRALSDALNKIAEVREHLRAEFRLAAARDEAPAAEQPAPAAEEKPAAPKRTRATKPATAAPAETATPSDSSTSAESPASTATTASPSEDPKPAAAPSAQEAAAASTASSSASVSLEQVRAKLAELSQAGKAADVKKLIADFGAAKLTDIPADKYGDLLQKAEAIE